MSWVEDYKHIYCNCGGVIGMWDGRKGFVCEKCKKEYGLHELSPGRILINEKTGWQFPMETK